MKKFVVVGLVAASVIGLLFASFLSGEDRTVFAGDDSTFIESGLVTDGAAVWASVGDSDDLSGSAEVIRFDAETGDVEWREHYGIGPSGGLFLVDEKLWAFAWEPLPPEPETAGAMLVRVDPSTGDVVDQSNFPSTANSSIVVDDVIWALDWTLGLRPSDVYIHDVESAELVDTIKNSALRKPDGEYFGNLEEMTLLGETMWLLDGSALMGVDTTSYEMAGFLDLDDFEFDRLEAHGGLLWVGKIDSQSDGTVEYEALKVDPEKEEVERVDFFDSPLGSVEFDGFTYDVVGPDKVAQVDTETGEQVATFTDLDPFSVIVTDGYLWAHDRKQIFRYPTKQ